MIVGGGEESTDLYTGAFQTVKVLSDAVVLHKPQTSDRRFDIADRGPATGAARHAVEFDCRQRDQQFKSRSADGECDSFEVASGTEDAALECD